MFKAFSRLIVVVTILSLLASSADSRTYRRRYAVKKWTPPAVTELLPRYTTGVLETEMVLEKGYLLPAVSRFATEALGLKLSAEQKSGTPAGKQNAQALKALGDAIKGVDAAYFTQTAFQKSVDPAEIIAYYNASKAAKGMKRIFFYRSGDGSVTSVWSAWGGKDILFVRVAPADSPGVKQRLYASRIFGSVDFTKLLNIPLVRQMIERSDLS